MLDPKGASLPYNRALLRGLSEKAWKVKLLTRRLTEKEKRFLGEIEVEEFFYRWSNGLPSYAAPLKLLEHCVDAVRFCLRQRREGLRVIHFQWSWLPFVDLLLVKFLRRRSACLFTAHNSVAFHGDKNFWAHGLGYKNLLKSFNAIFVHSRRTITNLEAFGVPRSAIHRIHHGLLWTRAHPDRVAELESLRNTEAEFRFLFLGNLRSYKGLSVLFQAAEGLAKGLNTKWVIRVSGSLEDASLSPMIKRIRSSSYADHFDWNLKRLSDEEAITEIYSSEVLLMPYLDIDASGIFTLALQNPVAVLASRMGVFEEALRDACPESLVTAGDVTEWANRMIQFANDPSLRAKSKQSIAALGESWPTWKEIAATTAKVYDRYLT